MPKISLVYMIPLITLISCFEKFQLPVGLYISEERGYNVIDSIEESYTSAIRYELKPFKTLNNIYLRNTYRINEFENNVFKIYEGSPYFDISGFLLKDNKLLSIIFYCEKRTDIDVIEEQFYFKDGTLAPPHINDIESKIKIKKVLNKKNYQNDKSDTIDETFMNLKIALHKKYGRFNYYHKGDVIIEDNNNYSISYIWYIDGVKITLSRSSGETSETVMYPSYFDADSTLIATINEYNNIYVKSKAKWIKLEYEDIVKTKLLEKHEEMKNIKDMEIQEKKKEDLIQRSDSIRNKKVDNIHKSL